jgi:RNA polymerase sigma-70 factor (ECF subfamily)
MPAMAPTGARDEVVKEALRYRDAYLSQAYAVLLDWAAAEDAVQEALVVALGKWEGFTPGTNVFAWVRRIVQLKSLEALRARGRERTRGDVLELIDRALDEHLDEASAERQRRMREGLRRCMEGLDRASLALLSDFYWRMLSYEELATRHRRSVNALRLALSRLRMRLRACLERRLAGDRA